jgi:hypothetical protein
MTRQSSGGKAIGQILNMFKEVVKLGVTGSAEKAEELKQSYEPRWRFDPKNDFIHPFLAKANKWGTFTMGNPIGSLAYEKLI